MTDDKNKHPEEQVLMEGDPDTTGHVLGRHQGVQQPAAAVVAVDLLCLHRLGVSTRCLSGLAADQWRDPWASWGFSTRVNVAEDIAALRCHERRYPHAHGRGRAGRDQPGRHTRSLQLCDPGRCGDLCDLVFAVPRVRRGGVQASGYPNLLDDDWLWGGTIDDIHYTVSHGIRNEDDLTPATPR
jgi:cytochrome c oxidase cbb3-type subunit 3